MIRKIVLTAFLFINFATFANAADKPSVVLYQTITKAEAEALDISIPTSMTPGFKSLEVKVTDASSATEFKKILFCKDLHGVIQWDNICPDLTRMAAQTALESAKTRADLPVYNPLSDPKQTTDTVIIAFAALTVFTGAGTIANRILKVNPTATASSGNQQGYLAQVSRGGVLVASSQIGRGDKAEIWNRPVTQKMDGTFTNLGKRVSGFSPLATRIISDGNYLRSLAGPFSLLIYPVSIALGWFASRGLHQQALPPSLTFILLMMTVGVIDALAGVLTALAFAMSVFIGGHFNSLDSVLTVIGVCLLAFSPALLAGAFRPFRRQVWDFTSLWERCMDYLLASVLTGWVVQQIVLGLPGLSGLQLPLTADAREIALWAAGLIILRFAAEDIAVRLFPGRLTKLEPEYRERTINQQVLATIFKVTIFTVIAGKFVGISMELFIGSALFALPLIMGIFEDKFPKSAGIQKWMPTGMIEMLTMTLVGYLLAIMVQARYPEARTYVLVSFVLLSLPGFILKILGLFGKDGAKDWKVTKIGVTTYRVLGVLVLATLIYIILSGLLVSNNV